MFLTNSVAALISGDASIQSEILQNVSNTVAPRVLADPQRWLSVREIAEMYQRFYCEATLSRAEAQILGPLGLTRESFLSQQAYMNEALVMKIAQDLSQFELPGYQQALLVGLDTNGPQPDFEEDRHRVYPHIYVATGQRLDCQDITGFAGIGIGQTHAASQFMSAGHVRSRPLNDTLYLTYSAKKRAEIAPGVGRATDMIIIGPYLGHNIRIGDHVITGLDKIYQTAQKEILLAAQRAERDTSKFIASLTQPQSRGQLPTPDPVIPPSTTDP